MPHVLQEKTGQVAVENYASLLKSKIVGRTNATVVLSNTGLTGHTIKWKVLVSNDPEGASGTWSEEKAEATLNAGATPVRHVVSGPFCWCDIQIASNDPGESGEGNCWLMAVGL
jgi:hypothetical protein